MFLIRNGASWKKNTGIPSIRIPLNTACRNYYLDSRFAKTVMVPELVPRDT